MRSIAAARSAAVLAIASIAVAGITGTSEAAKPFSGSIVKKSSLPGDRIKPNSLSGVQINEARLGVVPAAKLANFAEFAKSADTARTADFAKAADSARTAETARTADVAKDAQKLNGRDDTAFLSNAVRTVFNATGPINGTGGSATITASCNPDEKAIGGGAGWMQLTGDSPTQLNVEVTASIPAPATNGATGLTGWTAAGVNNSASQRILRAYAVCVPKIAA
jgi:hypothetical protein